jgi:hypothetical protein
MATTVLGLSEREESLREAAATGNQAVLTSLLQGGVDPNSQNKMNGWTALHWAATRDHPHSVTLLLKFGASPLIRNHSGKTPQDVAGVRAKAVFEGRISDAFAPREVQLGETEGKFVPNYLRNPDFIYSAPKPVLARPKQPDTGEPQGAAAQAVAAPPTVAAAAAPASAPAYEEPLVLVGVTGLAGSPLKIGAVSPATPLAELFELLKLREPRVIYLTTADGHMLLPRQTCGNVLRYIKSLGTASTSGGGGSSEAGASGSSATGAGGSAVERADLQVLHLVAHKAVEQQAPATAQ